MLASKLKKIKIPLRYRATYSFWRLLNIIVAGTLLTSTALAVYFIHQNINIALVNTALITNIKTYLTFDILDIESYEKIKKNIETKQIAKPIPNDLRNIFTYGKAEPDKK